MTTFYRFPLVLSALFFLANVLFCQWNHRDSQEGVFRMNDSVIRYVESLEAKENGKVIIKSSGSNEGLL